MHFTFKRFVRVPAIFNYNYLEVLLLWGGPQRYRLFSWATAEGLSTKEGLFNWKDANNVQSVIKREFGLVQPQLIRVGIPGLVPLRIQPL